MLFDEIDVENQDYLSVTVDFYAKLNALGDEELAAGDFSRAEIESGLEEVKRLFGVEL